MMDLDPMLLGFITFVGVVVVLLFIIGCVTIGFRAGRTMLHLNEKLIEERRVKADEPKRETASDDLERFITTHYKEP